MHVMTMQNSRTKSKKSKVQSYVCDGDMMEVYRGSSRRSEATRRCR
jgi:hypothetical protein